MSILAMHQNDDCDNSYDEAPRRSQPPVYERYKYKVVRRDWETIGEFVKKMNRLGYHGWEVIEISRDPNNGAIEEVVLKRYYEPRKFSDTQE